MLLTPAKIKNHHFEASGRNSYRAESVDSFFEEVSESYEKMFEENGEMFKKISQLAERLEEYKKDEDNIRNALLVAQRSAEKTTSEAIAKAEALITAAEQRAQSENEKTDAAVSEKLQKAAYEAKAIIDEANRQAEKIINDATYDSKEAGIKARDSMIKEEAALEMMKVEVTKFKTQILDMYSEQLALIEQLPEIVREKIDQSREEEPAVPAQEEQIPAETEIPAEAAEAPATDSVSGEQETAEEPEEASGNTEDEEPEVEVEILQQMIDESEDEDAPADDADEVVDAGGAEGETDGSDPDGEASGFDDIVLPKIDSDEETVDRVISELDGEAGPGDIMFTKPAGERKNNFAEIESDSISDENQLDEDEDAGKGDGFSSKFKGFFKKK